MKEEELSKAPSASGKAGILAGLAKTRIYELKSAASGLRTQRDNYLVRLEELETILVTFKQEYNPNFNDEGVKRAARSWEEYSARQNTNSNTESEESREDGVLDELLVNDGIEWEEFERSAETENDTAVCKY